MTLEKLNEIIDKEINNRDNVYRVKRGVPDSRYSSKKKYTLCKIVDAGFSVNGAWGIVIDTYATLREVEKAIDNIVNTGNAEGYVDPTEEHIKKASKFYVKGSTGNIYGDFVDYNEAEDLMFELYRKCRDGNSDLEDKMFSILTNDGFRID